MTRAKKPNSKSGLVQPFISPELSDSLILDLECHLGITCDDPHRAEKVNNVTAAIEHQLGGYKARRMSIDNAPSQASIKAEILPIMKKVDELEEMLEFLTLSSLQQVNEKNVGLLNENAYPIDKAILSLNHLRDLFRPLVDCKDNEARGGSNRKEARRILIVELNKIYKEFSATNGNNINFIIEILENQDISVPEDRRIREILES